MRDPVDACVGNLIKKERIFLDYDVVLHVVVNSGYPPTAVDLHFWYQRECVRRFLGEAPAVIAPTEEDVR
jgi:hypothetical protein